MQSCQKSQSERKISDATNRGPSVFFGAVGVRLVDQPRHLDGPFDGLVVMEMQRRHRVDMQAPEQLVVQMAGGMRERFQRLLRVAGQRGEVDLRVGVIRRQLDALDCHDPDARIFDLAQQFRQIALDLIGDLDIAIGEERFFGMVNP